METGFRAVLKKHALLVGGLAVLLPLAVIFYLQYRTLKTLEETLPAHRKSVLTQHLREVIETIATHYEQNAERALAVPVKMINFGQGVVIRDNREREASLCAVAGAAEHFKNHDFKGARRYFIAVATELDGVERSEIFFYDPDRQAMIYDPQASELTAINVACSAYMIYIRKGSRVMPNIAGVDRDPNVRLLVKPIFDKPYDEQDRKLVAIAGLVLDQTYLSEKLLPDTIREVTPKYLPGEIANAIISLRSAWEVFAMYDGTGAKLKVSKKDPQVENEVYQPFYMTFATMRLALRLKDSTVRQWARRNFMINLSLWSVMALLLLGGLALMLRTASREMKLTQMKADFVSNVSHELRTPLASIRVLAELLNLGRISESNKVREYGGYIESEGRRLTQLINNILDFSRIESGRKIFNFEKTDLKEIVDVTLQSFSLQLNRSGFELDYEPPKDELPRVLADPDAITLALNNLLDNAIKYSRESKRIRVRLHLQNGFLIVEVADSGIGISREEHAKIFEKFYRVGTGLVHDVKGSGLGLSLVKHIIEAHRGRITVESEAGMGSSFKIHLPVEGSGAFAK